MNKKIIQNANELIRRPAKKKMSPVIRLFKKLEVNQGLYTNKSKSQQMRSIGSQMGRKISVSNLKNNRFLVVRLS